MLYKIKKVPELEGIEELIFQDYSIKDIQIIINTRTFSRTLGYSRSLDKSERTEKLNKIMNAIKINEVN